MNCFFFIIIIIIVLFIIKYFILYFILGRDHRLKNIFKMIDCK